MGLAGEAIVDDTCWVVKTHSPWLLPMIPMFKCNKIIVVVRNPVDVLISWLNLRSMLNHNVKAPFDYEIEYPKWWDWWVRHSCDIFATWYKLVLEDCRNRRVPYCFIRYEDLVNDPEAEYVNIMRFFLGKKDLTGTNAERRIKEVMG